MDSFPLTPMSPATEPSPAAGPNAEESARLLAAASDLLAALETVNEWSITSQDDDFPYPCVEAALRKARGR